MAKSYSRTLSEDRGPLSQERPGTNSTRRKSNKSNNNSKHGNKEKSRNKQNICGQNKEGSEDTPNDVTVQSNSAVGIGSGSTIVYAAERLAQLVAEGKLTNIRCVPTSFQSLQLIRKHRLVLTDLEESPELDVTIDGADEADAQLNCIKGGGGCQTQEKIVAAASKQLIIVADYRKNSVKLGQQWKKGIPVEVIPFAYVPVMNKIEAILHRKPVLRQAANKAGPVVTDNGNFILDCPFVEAETIDWAETATQLKMIPGVVETGLFIGLAKVAYYGLQDGGVQTVKAM